MLPRGTGGGGRTRSIEVKFAKLLYFNIILPRMLVNSCTKKVKMFLVYFISAVLPFWAISSPNFCKLKNMKDCYFILRHTTSST